MHVDHRLAAVELGEHRGKGGVSEPLVAIARHQPDAVGLEHIEGIFDLLEAAFGVGQRQRGEQAEAPGVILDDLHGVIVERARKPAPLLHVAEEDAGRGHGDDGGLDAILVHGRERGLRRPPVPGGNDAAAALRGDPVFHLVEPERRHDVMMHVDELGPALGRRLRQGGGRGERGAGAESGRGRDEFPPGRAAEPAPLPVLAE